MMSITSPTGPTEYLDDISAPTPPLNQEWGFHCLIDASGCAKSMNSKEAVAKFVADMVKALKMKPLGPLELVSVSGDKAVMYHFDGTKQTDEEELPEEMGLGRGISAVQIITTSTITFHGDEEGDEVFLDVFSCSEYEPQTAIDLFTSRFKPKHFGTRWILRDARPTQPAGEPKQIEVVDLAKPVLLVCPPFTLSNAEKNNPLMYKDNTPVNKPVAFEQWDTFYTQLCKDAMVYIMPHQGNFQDRPYVANIGCSLGDTFLLSNFKSPPRQGEENIAESFLSELGFNVRKSPYFFEGEADLKWQRDNLYFGGYGIRTDKRAYDKLKDLDIEVVPIEMTDKKLYHFDCLFFPLSDDQAVVCTDVLSKNDVKQIEKHVDIIPVPVKYKYKGWTNSVRLGKKIYTAEKTFVPQIKGLGFQPNYIELKEFEKSGADLSCLVCHLNHAQRGQQKKPLTLHTLYGENMPWKMRKNGEKFDVVKESNGKVIGHKLTKARAASMIRALYANEPTMNAAGSSKGYPKGVDMDVAKQADLIVLPEGVNGTNCGNCMFFSNGFCKHPKVKQPVTNRMCCKYWNRKDVKRPWGKMTINQRPVQRDVTNGYPLYGAKKCPNCGRMIPRMATECPYCGYKTVGTYGKGNSTTNMKITARNLLMNGSILPRKTFVERLKRKQAQQTEGEVLNVWTPQARAKALAARKKAKGLNKEKRKEIAKKLRSMQQDKYYEGKPTRSDIEAVHDDLVKRAVRSAKSSKASKARSDAMRSIGMKRTPYGWE